MTMHMIIRGNGVGAIVEAAAQSQERDGEHNRSRDYRSHGNDAGRDRVREKSVGRERDYHYDRSRDREGQEKGEVTDLKPSFTIHHHLPEPNGPGARRYLSMVTLVCSPCFVWSFEDFKLMFCRE
jgi:hypothetical protein